MEICTIGAVIDTATKGSPGWWLNACAKKLAGVESRGERTESRLQRLSRLWDYYEGTKPLPRGAENAPEIWKAYHRKARSSLAELVVKSPVYRLHIRAIRTGDHQGPAGDETAWRLWRSAGLDITSQDVHRTFGWAGDAYVIVGAHPQTGEPIATAEDPRQVVTIHDPADQRRIIAAAKFYWDPVEERQIAYLYLRRGDSAEVFTASRVARTRPAALRFGSSWDWVGESRSVPYFPVVRFRNEDGVSEFEKHTDTIDRIAHLKLQILVIAQLQAFKQRAVMLPDETLGEQDERGNPVDFNDLLTADPASVWILPTGASLWESGTADLTPLLSAVKNDLQQLAAETFTPLSMFMPEGQNQTAEGASFAREGETFKCEDRKMRLTPGWVQVLRLLFLAAGDVNRAHDPEMSILWAPSERYSLAEKFDAASKATAAGLPWSLLMSDVLQLTPEQMARAEAEKASEEQPATTHP